MDWVVMSYYILYAFLCVTPASAPLGQHDCAVKEMGMFYSMKDCEKAMIAIPGRVLDASCNKTSGDFV